MTRSSSNPAPFDPSYPTNVTALLLSILVLGDDPAPILPIGSSAEYQATAYRLASALEAGRWDEATRLADRLPKPRFALTWDDRSVPERDRAAFARARDRALSDWRRQLASVEPTLGPGKDVRVGFQPELPPGPGEPIPAGAVAFTSDDPSEPRLDVLVALHRESGRLPIDSVQVQNEVSYAVGAYLGLARTPRGASVMSRTDLLQNLEHRVSPAEALLARETLRVADALRTAARTKTRLSLARPEAFVDPQGLRLDPVPQGDVVQTSIQVTNRGKGPLAFRVTPDCACFTIRHTPVVQPGQTGLVQVFIDTGEFPGPFDKALYLYSNDPDQPVRRIRVQTRVVPAYRFLRDGEGPVVLGEAGGKVDVYFAIDPARPIRVLSASTSGVSAIFEQSDWSGVRPDPELGEGPVERKGQRFSLLIGPRVVSGRSAVTLSLKTDSTLFPTLHFTVPVQRGIVALPQAVNLGQQADKARPAWFLVSRPGRPFRILKVESDTEFLLPEVAPFRGGDYRVTLRIKPDAPAGSLDAKVTVTTDDPEQPTLVVPVTGVLR